ncbi:MAG: hypothetical protein HXX12_06640 [Geothrix sp.]|uniref:hypothetical protein n=1 Tax=Geothrix sp. TaxID=1962974 RepID=UPI0017C7B5CF|nr:hypothetical protein [Geothrix sp.]NWJ40633.1 hypothetical protein [Geothrix sp.]WIL21358.1 MAG: hypothetical protein QOZ81_000617 [Geothrix sp.]
MTDTFQARIPTLSEVELRQVLAHFEGYRTEAVEAALAELEQRGLTLAEEERTRIRQGLAQRDAAVQAHLHHGFVARLGDSLPARLARIRQLTALLLAAGLGAALAIYLATAPQATNPLGYEPMNTKKYLRDLELYGGKVNVLATEFMGWWNDRWQGRNLATTVACLTVLAAGGFWLLATRRARDLERHQGEASGQA